MMYQTKKQFSIQTVMLAFVFVGLTACGSSNLDGTAGVGEVAAVVEEGGSLIGTPSENNGGGLTPTSNFALNILDRDNLTSSQSTKLDQAVALANAVMNSQAFKDRVINFTYSGAKQFVQNGGLTNEQVYETLMAAAEQYPTKSAANGLADMKVTIYYPPWYSVTSAVAYTSTSDAYLHIYNSYFSSSDLAELAATLIHEWTHKLGFEHDYDSTARRPYTVPYGVGTIVDSLARKL